MRYLKPLALVAASIILVAIAACAEGEPGTTDENTDSADATEASDVTDPSEDETDSADATDAADDTDATDATDPSDTEPVEETSGGLDCSTDDTVCEAPFECMEGACRMPITSLAETEVEFTFAQPEELDEIFSLFKTFAAGLKFFAMETATNTAIPGRYSAIYGAADIISESPLTISWQHPEEPEYVFFVPHTPANDDGRGWVTETFTYKLRADASIQFGTFATDANIALDILDAVIIHRQDLEGGNSTANLSGHLTREEAEYRELGTHEELEGIMLNFVCKEITDYVPAPNSDGEVKWRLSDVLDCNLAEMDVDRDNDGTMDTYQVELDVVLGATLFE